MLKVAMILVAIQKAIKDTVLKCVSFYMVLEANVQMALGVFYALLEVGIKVPKTVSVVVFDGIQSSQFFYHLLLWLSRILTS